MSPGKPTIGIWNEETYQLIMNADTLYRLQQTLDPSLLRAVRIVKALVRRLLYGFE